MRASQIPWALDDGVGTMLPIMQSDITLSHGNKVLIIDAKYYSHTTQVQYEKHNGLLKDFSVLQSAPFTDNGSIVEVFTDLTVWMGIKRIIDRINSNAIAA